MLDPWLESRQIQKLLSQLLVKANRFILTIDGWIGEGLLDFSAFSSVVCNEMKNKWRGSSETSQAQQHNSTYVNEKRKAIWIR